MSIYENDQYQEDLKYISELNLPWEYLQDTSIVVSGASGMIGSCFIDAVHYRNIYDDMNCKIYAIGRSEEKAKSRFEYCWRSPFFQFVVCDINKPLKIEGLADIGYVLHLASNTHPIAYATDPIGTVATNVIGTNNMLDFAVSHHAKRFVFASSNEIYGENRGDVEFFDEKYCGYINPNTLRAGYPESKRCGEALCQAYRSQKSLNIVIPRFTRSYGPTMLMSDTKAISQFIKKGICGEDIVLKSTGTQYYSYTYVVDAVTGLLTILLKGIDGEAYNIADESGDIMLKDLASIISKYANTKVVFELPDEIEQAGYSVASKARLDGSKLKSLGWNISYNIESGLIKTMDILKVL